MEAGPRHGLDDRASRPDSHPHGWQDWVGLAARLILGGALIWAGAIKVGNPEANVASVQNYQLPLSDGFVQLVGYAQPMVEILVGALLVVGLFTRSMAALGALAMLLFIGGISWAWARGLRIDCGCFSEGGLLAPGEEPKYRQDILRDVGLMACGVWLIIRPRSPLALDNWLSRGGTDPVKDPKEIDE